MKFRINPVFSAISIALLSITTAGVAQQGASSNISEEDAKLNALMKKIDAQETNIKKLTAEVNVLKNKRSNAEKKSSSAEKKASQAITESSAALVQSLKTKASQERLMDLGASPAITSPYLGIPSRWDASDLMVNEPTINEDVELLKRDAQMDKAVTDLGFPLPSNPVLELSGKVEAQAYETKPFSGNSQSNITVSAAEMDFVAHVSKWVNGLMDISYDNSAPSAYNGEINAELTSNSHVYVSQGFIVIGNLTQSPFYGTIGLRSLPYGHYSSYMISNPYTQNLFKIKNPAILLGYSPMIGQIGPYAKVFAFKGDTSIGTASSKINNYGTDIGYLFDLKKISGNIGISAVANVADALGMQANGLTTENEFQGFGYAPNQAVTSEVIQHRVPGLGANLEFSKGPYTFIAEGNMATTRFAPQDMTYNGHGAKPGAAHIEGVYNFEKAKYPTSFAIGYDHTWQALALASPQSRYIATLATSLFKDTIEDLEFKHEINYSANDTASGQSLSVILPGHSSNTLTAQVGYYF
jgi:hypothetical protein